MSTTYSPTVVSPLQGVVRANEAALKLWGDDVSGHVNDWIYVANERIQHLVFSMAPGARFGHSERYRTNLGADEIFYVMSGVLLLANPETGEVHRVEPGEAVWFGRDTWHHGLNCSSETLCVLEFFAPPPAAGTSQTYANTKPYLTEPRYSQDEWLGNWPLAADAARAQNTQHVIRPQDILWRVEGTEHRIVVGVFLSTAQLTAGVIELLPGQHSDARTHGGDLAGYVAEGRLNLCILDPEGNPRARQWFQCDERDGVYVPAGTAYQLFNMTDRPVRLMFGVAPAYLPNGD